MKTFLKVSLIFIGILCVPLILFSVFYHTPAVQNIIKSSPLFSHYQSTQKTDTVDKYGYPVFTISFKNGDGLTVDVLSSNILYGWTYEHGEYVAYYSKPLASYRFFFKYDKENSNQTPFNSETSSCFLRTLSSLSGLTAQDLSLNYFSDSISSGRAYAHFYYCYKVVQYAGIYGNSTVEFSSAEWYRLAGVRPYVESEKDIPNVSTALVPFPYFRSCLPDDFLSNILPNSVPDNPILFLYTVGKQLVGGSTFFMDVLTFNIGGVSLFTVIFGGGFLVYVGWVIVKWFIPT